MKPVKRSPVRTPRREPTRPERPEDLVRALHEQARRVADGAARIREAARQVAAGRKP